EAEAKASEAEAKSCALEGQLRTVEQDLSTKLTQLNQAQQRIVELEFADKHYAILLQTKELALENIRTNLALEIFAHNKAEEKGLDLKSQLDVASQQFGSVSSALESAKNNISKLQSALSLSESELKVAELAIQQKKSELEAVLTEQKSIQLALVNQQQETEKLQQELNASLGNAHNWYLKAQEFETNLHSTNQQLADSLSNAHHWYLAASLHIERVEAMEKTISWKITKPLRLLKKWTITIVKSPWLLIKSMAKAVLNPLMRFVLNRPSLKDKLLNKIKKFPSLFNRLKLFAQNQNLIFGYQQIITEQKLNQAMELELQQSVQRVDANSPLSMQEELTQLSPRAKQIYTQLKQAIENQKNKS
ncbi:MAG: hypothetical protein JXR42_02175, partial [Gammaproteobacteria bacterium]|nr:hypothetical protein [Gammaproteobacteria bacterium]